jgi:anti-sigma regulatory factor (Ser/Thr protein kinase)
MDSALGTIKLLRGFFEEDNVSLYYNGVFTDEFTTSLIDMAEKDLGKSIRKRTAFMMAESFQNIVRHGNEEDPEHSHSLFGASGRHPYLSIYSSNLVNGSVKSKLEHNLRDLNNLDQAMITQRYRQILEIGELSEKGGAGLGLIEMARKSKQPLQSGFRTVNQDAFVFNMQVDLVADKEVDLTQFDGPPNVSHNAQIGELMIGNEVLFTFQGEFNDELLIPLIHLFEGNAEVNTKAMYTVYTTAVELMQNVARHAVKSDDERRGIIVFSRTAKGYYVATGNFMKDDNGKLEGQIKRLNSLSVEALNKLYRSTLIESAAENGSNAGVGLIDISRMIPGAIDIEVTQEPEGLYATIGIEIIAAL